MTSSLAAFGSSMLRKSGRLLRYVVLGHHLLSPNTMSGKAPKRRISRYFMLLCGMTSMIDITACSPNKLQENIQNRANVERPSGTCRAFRESFEQMMTDAVYGEISVTDLTNAYDRSATERGSQCEVPPRGITAADPVPTPRDIDHSYVNDANRSFALRSAAMQCDIYDPNSITGPLDWLLSPCVQQKLEMWQRRGNAPRLPPDKAQTEAVAAKLRETSAKDKNSRYLSAQMTAWNWLTDTPFFYKVSLASSTTEERILDELRSINRTMGTE